MANQAALNLFNATFPNGAFHAQVSGSGLLCGLRAIRASIIHQHPYIDPPKSQTLLEVFYSDRIQGPNQALGAEAMVNTNNFYVDQLGAVLYHWGMTQGYNLRLWYIVDDGQCYLVVDEYLMNEAERAMPESAAIEIRLSDHQRATKTIIVGDNRQRFAVRTNLFAFLRRLQATLSLVCKALLNESFLEQHILQKIILQLPQGWRRWPKSRRRKAICSICSTFSGDEVSWEPEQLRDLRHQPNCFLNLWIDAICINQDDLAEKARQIPMMARIYRTAARVLIWLGEYSPGFSEQNATEMDALLGKFDSVSKNFEAFSTEDGDIIDFFKSEDAVSIAANMSTPECFQVFAKFVRLHKWFERVWVVQELAVASGDPAILLGNHIWGWQRLSTYCAVLFWAMWAARCDADSPVGRPAHAVFQNISSMWSVRNIYQRDPLVDGTFVDDCIISQRLHDILKYTDNSNFYSTYLSDHLYAVLGMAVPPAFELPERLHPDYNKPPSQVFHQLTAYMMESSGYLSPLRVLNRTALPDDGYSAPSWVPNWKRDRTDMGRPEVRCTNIRFSNNDRELHVEGVSLGKVPFFRPLDKEEIYKRAKLHGANPSAEVSYTLESAQRAWDNLQDFMTSNEMDFDCPSQGELALLEYELVKLWVGGDLHLFVMGNTHLGLFRGPSGSITGAVVYMIKGAPGPSILMPVEEGGKYRLVCGVLKGPVFDPEEGYYAENTLENLTIV
ncbi:heterokaryon incompatibility protein-domain-containing protein [Podospora aff. communis PSN243]|uniref:Heterokaryon incompatibility protein-domain-containing protein n=1 Tax=Podospora aff. communis PSN243 TaxID=3040156 RepID=A0AAV9G5W7_9PEZI|nr:heterokaryon incompatibility protein-domain-containing protein [Podospora aff. communis PSN243]